MKKPFILWISLLIMLSLACNVSTQVPPPPDQAQPGTVVSEQQPADPLAATVQPEATTEPQVIIVTATPGPTEIPSRPVSIRAGLLSLNSYVMTINTKTAGPTAQDLSEIAFEITYSSDQDAQVTHIHNRSSSVDDPEVSEADTFMYRIGLEQCNVSDDSYEYDSISPSQKEMTDLMGEMLDMTPVIADPQLVGAETVNGIETNHFTFQISGFGSSGAQVLTNQGEYWLALDGNYIVKYSLELATQDNEGQVLQFETRIELSQVNQPVEVVMPEGCTAP